MIKMPKLSIGKAAHQNTSDRKVIPIYKSGIEVGGIEFVKTGGRFRRSRITIDGVERSLVTTTELANYSLTPHRSGAYDRNALNELVAADFLD
jgi:hypothetical protein